MDSLFKHVIEELFDKKTISRIKYNLVSGGCINQAAVVEYDSKFYFIKWNSSVGDLFDKEASGLKVLRESSTVNIPEVLLHGCFDQVRFLCLEYIETNDSAISLQFWEAFGAKLAQMHRVKSQAFGLHEDNFIGRLVQFNSWKSSWVDFFVEQRLLPQLKLAIDQELMNKSDTNKFEKLFLKLNSLMPEESPSLLHGDLWSGNFLCSKNQQPYIFDPAIYYGHREAELAFTKMFGGFDNRFYDSYQASFPLQSGYKKRVELFNLYPLLVHVNLFGASYLRSIHETLKRFV